MVGVVLRRSWGRERRGVSGCCCGGGRDGDGNVFIASKRARGD